MKINKQYYYNQNIKSNRPFRNPYSKWVYITFVILCGYFLFLTIKKDSPIPAKICIKPKVEKYDTLDVKITTYHATIKECGKNFKIINKDTFFITAYNFYINESIISINRTIGMSRDLIKK